MTLDGIAALMLVSAIATAIPFAVVLFVAFAIWLFCHVYDGRHR